MNELRKFYRQDPHAFECYSCEQASSPPASTPACKGCIGRPTRPHWTPHPRFAEQAKAAIDAAIHAKALSPTTKATP